MNDEDKAKLRELWDFMSELHDSSCQRLHIPGNDAPEVMDKALRKFEELFSKELND